MHGTEGTYYHTAIIGAGAAGLFCAGSFHHEKIVLEANAQPALKVRASGGGKCNFSNCFVTAADYLSQNKHFCKNALAAFGPAKLLRLLKENNIPFEQRAGGELFAFSSGDMVRFLVLRARAANTHLACGVRVLEILPQKDGFLLHTSSGKVHSKYLVLATGGLSYPQLGASSFGLQAARKLGLRQVETYPVLCGLVLPKAQASSLKLLAGNSLPVKITCGKHHFEGPLLFTHGGISGPAVLQASLFWRPGQTLEIDFLPQHRVTEIFRVHKNSTQPLSTVLKPFFPGKMAKVLLGDGSPVLANATRSQLQQAARCIHHFQTLPTATSGYTHAEATAGGIDTRELNPSTLEVRKIPGLYAVGEVVDVTGRVGGFNLQWAWSSGFAAAQALSKKF